jgi:hypothetical protein
MAGAFQISEHQRQTIKPTAALNTSAGPKGEPAATSKIM